MCEFFGGFGFRCKDEGTTLDNLPVDGLPSGLDERAVDRLISILRFRPVVILVAERERSFIGC